MAWIRQQPSGRWAATVRTPDRITKTFRLKQQADEWAKAQESDVDRGDWLDPRHAKTTLTEVWEKYGSSRKLEKASRRRDASHWRVWVQPRWGDAPIGSVLKPDIQTWVNKLEEDKVGGWTIIAALNVTKAVFELAVDAGLIRANPARRVKPPVPPQHEDRVLDADEELVLLKRLDELFPDRRDAGLFVEGLLETGARWEELAAVKREAVDLRRGLIHIGPVMERDGTIREYPKGARSRDSAGFRPVPIGEEYARRLKPFVEDTEKGELVYTASMGGPMLYPTWLRRVWNAALRVPILEDGKRIGWEPLVAEPLPTPHDCRHGYGSKLADAGLELHDRMALMGHSDVRSSQRYTHSGEKRFDKAREALRRARRDPL